jgi:hypothetical protein
MRVVTLVAAVLACAVAAAGCGASAQPPTSPTSPRRGGATDSFGDPFVTDAQAGQVRLDEPQPAALSRLGGKSRSGYFGPGDGPTTCYDYPVRGTGDSDKDGDVDLDSTVYWQISFRGGHVTKKQRGRLDSLPGVC